MPEAPVGSGADIGVGTNPDEEGILGKEAYLLNLKRIVDDYAQESLDRISRSKAFTSAMDSIMVQCVQNAVSAADMMTKTAIETANMTGKQAIRHADSCVYNTDNPVSVGAGNEEQLRATNQKSTT